MRHSHSAKFPMLGAALGLALAGILPLPASFAAGIGVVDLDRIQKESQFVQDIQNDIEKRLGPRREALAQKEDDFDRTRQEMRRKESVLSDSEMDAMRRKTRDLRDQIEDETRDLQRVLTQAEKEKIEPAFDLILETIKAVGRDEGFDLILEGKVALYRKDAIDVTKRVIERLDREQKAAARRATETEQKTSTEPARPRPSRAPAISDEETEPVVSPEFGADKK
ncbi:MAG TPA: OmpH family outer membrane protein [Sumerlaeia bacterium]|nr:OmpH family outer membrane protein [Sumerlaeia bacterium]